MSIVRSPRHWAAVAAIVVVSVTGFYLLNLNASQAEQGNAAPEWPLDRSGMKRTIGSAQIISGTSTVGDAATFNFGTGKIFYSTATIGEGYLYARFPDSNPPPYFADVIPASPCSPSNWGYLGVAHIWEFSSAATHAFSTDRVVRLGDKDAPCYQGVLLFRQNGLYGGIDPLDIDSSGSLRFNWWYDSSGGSDFSSLAPPRSIYLPLTAINGAP